MGQVVYTAKYSVGDSVYYPVFATASIYVCTVESIYLRNTTLVYNLIRTDRDLTIPDVPESEVLSFAEAKAALVTYLTAKLTQLNSLTA
jgi:hypothetical protein